jgi:hypothetical protein
MFSQLGLGYSQLGVVGGAPAAAATTWDLSTVTAVTLSGGNLVATNTGTTAQEQGVHVASSHNPSTGKYYFECTITTFTGGAGVAVGIATPASTYTNIKIAADSGFLNSVVGHTGTGTILSPSGNTGFSLGALTTGAVICIAVDLTNRRIWFRAGAAGLQGRAAGVGLGILQIVLDAGDLQIEGTVDGGERLVIIPAAVELRHTHAAQAQG